MTFNPYDNKLRTWTFLSLEDYATTDYDNMKACAIDASSDANGMWWRGRISESKLLGVMEALRWEVFKTIEHFVSETDNNPTQRVFYGEEVSYLHLMAACAFDWTAPETNDNEWREYAIMAVLFCLCFYAGDKVNEIEAKENEGC